MAPPVESAYLPQLTDCLDGNSKLLSWKNVVVGLHASAFNPVDPTVAKYIEDPAAIQVLLDCFTPTKPNSQSKTQFETLTSAINVTPTPNGRYDIKELKEDALWLSQAAQIDEVQALRHTILEWQPRLGQQAALNLEEAELKDFNSAKLRRQRLLEVFFQEQQWLFRFVAIVAGRGVYGSPKGRSAVPKGGAVYSLAKEVHKAWILNSPQTPKPGKLWLATIRQHLQCQMDGLQTGNHILSREDLQDYVTDSLYATFIESSIIQIIHSLQIILLIQWSLPRPSPPDLVMEWFSWMETTAFFGTWLSSIPTPFVHYGLQVGELLILTSLAFVDLAASQEILPDLASTSAANEGQDAQVYLQSIDCIIELNRILGEYIDADNEVVAPVAIAWCTLLTVIHVQASKSIENRENRQTQRAIDNYGAMQQSDNDSLDGSSGRNRIAPHRRHSFGSDTSGQATLFEDIDEIVRSHPMGDDTLKHFGSKAAVQLGGFRTVENVARTSLSRLEYDTSPELMTCIREILVQFVKGCVDMGSLNYSPDVLNTLFTILAGRDGHWKFRARKASSPYPFEAPFGPLGEDFLLRQIMAQARGRFPYESVPFIELCRTLIPYQDLKSSEGDLILDILSDMSNYTASVSETYTPYDLEGEGEDMHLRLQNSIGALAMIFPSLIYNPFPSAEETNETLLIPSGTTGQPLRDDKPIIALWTFRYSALRFCGLTLQLQLQRRTASRQGAIDNEFLSLYSLNTEIIALLATWIMKIATENGGQDSSEKARALLANVSDDLDRNQDVIAVIFVLLEGELYKDRPGPPVVGFIFRCVQFLVALAKVMPSRVWSFLSGSGFLGLHGQENRLIAVIAAAEMSTGTYDIFLSSVQLLDVLIEDALRGTDSPRSSSMALKRFRSSGSNANGSGVKAITMNKVLHQFTRIVVDAVETCSSWNFKNQEHELTLRLGIYEILQKIVSYTFDYDDESAPEQKLSANLAPAANYLIENFLSQIASDTLLSPLFKALIDIIAEPSTSLPLRVSILRHSVASSSLDFMNKLVRLNRFLNYSTSCLTKMACENISILVNVFVLHDDLRLSVVRVLDAAINDIGKTSQPVPILGALSEPSAKAFMQCLVSSGLSRTDSSLSAATWSLFSGAITNNQRWVAMYLLLGKTPKESLQEKSSVPNKPAIRLALNRVTDVERLNPTEAGKLLEFVAKSASFWISVTQELKNDKECRDASLKYVACLQLPKTDKDIDASVPMKYQTSAYILDILALLVFRSNQQNDTSTLKHIIPNIKYLVEHGSSSPHYNASLHHGIQKNFEGLFPGSSLQHFKRTSFSQPQLGGEFYYDKTLANTIFGQNQAWTGKAGKGFEHEFTRANINLSLVEAQVNLFHSWKSLAIQLAEGLGSDRSFQGMMISIVKNCLEANQTSNMPEAIFLKLRNSRADLAFTLLQQLLELKSGSEETKSILHLAWKLVQSQITELGSVMVSEDADYTRTLLRILYLSLCCHENRTVDTTSIENNYTAIGLDILQIVVAQGFRSLIGQLHEDPGQVQPGDFVLIIAILRASLKLPGVINHSERLLAHFADERTIQHAGTLVSWSDQLATSGDPIYGELSIMFLLELSAIQVLAEAIIVNGTFAQISSTTLFSSFRRFGGFGPFDAPPRIYDIWSRGYLPLTLNIVGAVGAPVAVEMATIFAQFEPQLKRASLQFDPKSHNPTAMRLTLSMINEAHSLALLNLAFKKFRDAGSSVGINPEELPQFEWDASSMKEDLESLLGRRHTLRHSIVATDEREDHWSHQKPQDVKEGSQNRLEERIVEEINAALALMGIIE